MIDYEVRRLVRQRSKVKWWPRESLLLLLRDIVLKYVLVTVSSAYGNGDECIEIG